METPPRLSIVIPCFNESKRLPVQEFRDFFSKNSDNISFIFVNDGSDDGTEQLIEELCSSFPSKVNLLNLSQNMGKAEAVRRGALQAMEGEVDYIGYWDADLATSLEEIDLFLRFLKEKNQAILIMGSRVKLLGSAEVIRNEKRHYVGRIIATLISYILRIAVYDTQCGAKIIKASDAGEIFSEIFISRWLFDVEIIFRILKKYGYKDVNRRIFELPLSKWVEKGQSKVSWTYMFQLPFDLFRLMLTYSEVRSEARDLG